MFNIPEDFAKDITFFILDTHPNFSAFKITSGCIRVFYPQSPIFGILPSNDNADQDLVKRILPVKNAGLDFFSLVEKSMDSVLTKFGFIIFSGSWITPYTLSKYFKVMGDKDILYSVKSLKDSTFVKSSFNGLMFDADCFREVGNFDFQGNVSDKKIDWATRAICKGYSLKGIVGAKI
jgi:hypothetical protein